MFYYLLYNSSFTFIEKSHLFFTILYGSILYILSHAILNYCNASILTIIKNYYWTIFTLDIISFIYLITTCDNSNNNIHVSFNLLKNKINTFLDKKTELTITHIPNTNILEQPNISQKHIVSKSQTHNSTLNKLSTPISLIRNNINIIEPDINENNNINDINESIAGSDVGSIMDLTDFETTL